MTVQESLRRHKPSDRHETADLARILAFAQGREDPFDRRHAGGHLVGSALVVAADGERVLLLHHKKLDRWLQCGGHGEAGETSGEAVALREAIEETGIRDLRLHERAPRPLDVDVHRIPARGDEPAHDHLDLRYLVVAPREAIAARCVEETNDVRWFAWPDALALDIDHGLRRLMTKARTLVASSALLLLLLGATTSSLLAQATDPATRREHGEHHDVDAYIRQLDDPSRDGRQKPDEVVAALGLKPGAVVADIGSGSGYFTFRLAKAVGETGRVFAVDVEPAMVRHVDARKVQLGLQNVESILAPPDDPKLPESAVDLVFVCDVWHHVEKQEAYLAALRRALKPGGRVVMIDYQKRPLPVGPSMDLKIAREDLVAQMEKNGFRLAQEHGLLPYQYFLVFDMAGAAKTPASLR